MEGRFYEKFHKSESEKYQNSRSFPKSEYEKVVNRLLEIKNGEKKILADYSLMKRYELSVCDSFSFLVRSGKRLVHNEELFGRLQACHKSIVVKHIVSKSMNS